MAQREAARPRPIQVGPLHLRVVRGPNAEGRWYFRIWHGEETLWVGWATAEEATKEAASLVAANALDKPKPPPGPDRVLDLMTRWVAEDVDSRAGLTRHAKRNYRTRARHICSVLGELTLESVDLPKVEAYREARLTAGCASSSLRQELKSLRTAWSWGRARGLTPNRDLPKPRELRLPKPIPIYNDYTPSQEELDAAEALMTDWAAMALYIARWTGMRRSELAALTWGNVDLHGQRFRLTVTKGGEPREIPFLTAGMGTRLREWAVLTGGIDPTRRVLEPSPKYIETRFGLAIERACIAAEVPVFTPHGIRRATVNLLRRRGIDPATAAMITGHDVATMFKFYTEATSEDVAAVGRKLRGEDR